MTLLHSLVANDFCWWKLKDNFSNDKMWVGISLVCFYFLLFFSNNSFFPSYLLCSIFCSSPTSMLGGLTI